jgi:magnesium-protoporphyrin IX monomethyl ester (oxidative) cyclase
MRIALVNMPFAEWIRPSFALSQLSALAKRELGSTVHTDVRYLNVDFAHYFGVEVFDEVAGIITHVLTGLGDWLFRQVAFPELPDNAATYLGRYYSGPQWAELKAHILDRRAGLEEFCEELIDRYALAECDVLGFTSMFLQTVPSIAIARLVKRRNPSVITIMGGANCESSMGAVLAEHVSEIDYIFSGPALHTFPQFLHAIQDGDRSVLDTIPGIQTAWNARDPRFATSVGPDRDIDDFFEPDYGDFLDAFSANRDRLSDDPDLKPTLLFETSRGCWWGQRSHCTFCGLNGLGMGYRAMSPEVALRHFEWLFRYASVCQEFFCTDNIMPKNYTKEVFPKLDVPPDVSLFYEVKLPLSERDLQAMLAAGVRKVQPGIEALSTKTLKLMRKGTTSFLNVQFMRSCVITGMEPAWNLLVGFPGEDEDIYAKYLNDIPLMVHLPPPSGAFLVGFHRFSPYFTSPADYGLDLHPMDFYELIFPYADDDIERLAYYFADHSLSPYMLTAAKWIRPVTELVERWRQLWAGDAADRPTLSLHRDGDGTAWIADSRGVNGGPQRYRIGEHACRILHRLASPVSRDTLVDAVGLPPERVDEELDFLREHGLLFCEDGRMLSLVVDPEAVARPIIALDLVAAQ